MWKVQKGRLPVGHLNMRFLRNNRFRNNDSLMFIFQNVEFKYGNINTILENLSNLFQCNRENNPKWVLKSIKTHFFFF